MVTRLDSRAFKVLGNPIVGTLSKMISQIENKGLTCKVHALSVVYPSESHGETYIQVDRCQTPPLRWLRVESAVSNWNVEGLWKPRGVRASRYYII